MRQGIARHIQRRGRQLDDGRQLLALREIGLGAGADAVGGQFGDALVGLAAHARLDGDGHGTLARQGVEGRGLQRREAFGIQPGIAAHAAGAAFVGAVIVGRDQVERAVALGLDGQAAIQLQRGSQQGAQRHRLAGHAGGGLRQGMGAQRAGRGSIQPHHAAAHARLGDVERENKVAIGRRMGVHFVRHDRQYGAWRRYFKKAA